MKSSTAAIALPADHASRSTLLIVLPSDENPKLKPWQSVLMRLSMEHASRMCSSRSRQARRQTLTEQAKK